MTIRKALVIGINYTGTDNALNGCINDAKNIKEYLLKCDYKESDITFMTDETAVKPTRKNIITAVLDLVLSGADRLWFSYSGHGAFEPDKNGDEDDSKDETIIPIDFQSAGMINDDQLRGLLAFLNPSSKLTVLFDSCHSGTALDLTFTLQKKASWSRGVIVQKVTPTSFIMKKGTVPQTPAQVVLLSGCLDDQFSADAYEEGKYQGAMTYSFLKALSEKKAEEYTWIEFIQRIQGILTTKRYKQVANLSSGQLLTLTERVSF